MLTCHERGLAPLWPSGLIGEEEEKRRGTALMRCLAGNQPSGRSSEVMSWLGHVCSKEDNPATRNTRAERDMKMLWCVR